jgi:hypothetical protein
MREETRTALISLTDQGYIEVQIKPKVIVNADDADESVESILRLAGDRKRLLLIRGTGRSLIEKSAIKVFMDDKAAKRTLAAALYVDSRAGSLIGNIVIKKLKKDGIAMPVEIFSDESRAKNWLAEQRDHFHLDGFNSMIATAVRDDLAAVSGVHRL